MQIKYYVWLAWLFLIANPVWADLDGTVIDNGDGTYRVLVNNMSGHQYEGLAIPQPDGTLRIDVHDHNEETYTGRAIPNSTGSYDVNFMNDTTGHIVEGWVVVPD